MLRLTTLLVLILASAASGAPVPREIGKVQSIDGRWKLKRIVLYGQDVPTDEQVWTIKGELLITEQNGRRVSELQETLKPRPEINTRAYDYAMRYPPQWECIFEVKGDILYVAMSRGVKVRPTLFEPYMDVLYYEFKRVK